MLDLVTEDEREREASLRVGWTGTTVVQHARRWRWRW